MAGDGSIGIGQFRDWLIDAEDDIEAYGSEDEVELARLIDLRFAEFIGGHIDRTQLEQVVRREILESGLALPARDAAART